MIQIPDFAPYFKDRYITYRPDEYEEIIMEGLMKYACEYSTGYTLQLILIELNYLTPKRGRAGEYVLSKWGRVALWELFERLKKKAG